MRPHEQRVVDEHKELNDKIEKLLDFTITDTFHDLPEEDKKLLLAQGLAMTAYLVALERRIERFK